MNAEARVRKGIVVRRDLGPGVSIVTTYGVAMDSSERATILADLKRAFKAPQLPEPAPQTQP